MLINYYYQVKTHNPKSSYTQHIHTYIYHTHKMQVPYTYLTSYIYIDVLLSPPSNAIHPASQ